MKERPILFSAAMVRAILVDRKTQTRRVVRFRSCPNSDPSCHCPWLPTPIDPKSQWQDGDEILRNPYGRAGDRLWVRETFVIQHEVDADPPPFHDGRPIRRLEDEEVSAYWEQAHYRATDPTPELFCSKHDGPCCHWRPSIFMPRWASRLTLEIVKIRVERLQKITARDCLAEGIEDDGDPRIRHDICGEFQKLWDFINAKGGFGWAVNPWVWVIEFRKLDG